MASVPPVLKVSPLAARRFLRHALGFDAPFPDIGAALAHHGFIQIDPINVCGRMHDLILRNRVTGYREGDLGRYLHGHGTLATAPERRAFEHHLPDRGILVAFGLEAWPHLLGAMQARSRRTGPWSGRLTPRERELAPQLLAEIAARGPLSSEDFDDDRRAHRIVWGAASLVKSTLQKMFFHGRLLIAGRTNNRRRYDLPERVLPASVLAQPRAAAADTARWLIQLKLRQRRLARLNREELALVGDEVQPVQIEAGSLLYCLHQDAPAVAAAAELNVNGELNGAPGVTLLAPLDPLIYDRRVTAALWNFNYTWEAYTPPAKRVRGYYALPVLAGTELVGHVDVKADRVARRLLVVGRSVRRGYRAAPAVQELALWLGLRRVAAMPR